MIKSPYFPWNPQEALREGFEEADRVFLQMALNDLENNIMYERSGSCAIVVLLIGKEMPCGLSLI